MTSSKRNGRTFSEEVEARLYYSFDAEDDAAARKVARAALRQGAGHGHR